MDTDSSFPRHPALWKRTYSKARGPNKHFVRAATILNRLIACSCRSKTVPLGSQARGHPTSLRPRDGQLALTRLGSRVGSALPVNRSRSPGMSEANSGPPLA